MAEDERRDDAGLREALRDRIKDLGTPDAVVIGYATVVEVMTPDAEKPWLHVLKDEGATSWAQVGRVRGLQQYFEHLLDDGWEQVNGD